jgi:hypothetical protein
MTIYLYVKTHLKTGLKYLGKTNAVDPHKYPGSGLYWTRHLQEHGFDYNTEILKECQTNDEVKKWGLYYSDLWNVVKSDQWANLKPESGDGNDPETARSISQKLVKEGKHIWQDREAARQRANTRLANNDHHFLDKEWAREKELKKVKKGTHPFLGGEIQRKSNESRLSNGTHNFKGENNPNNIKMTCPHCGKTGGKPNMINHHFDRCKRRQ